VQKHSYFNLEKANFLLKVIIILNDSYTQIKKLSFTSVNKKFWQ